MQKVASVQEINIECLRLGCDWAGLGPADHLTCEGGGGGVILKKHFLQGYSEQRKIPALTNWGGGISCPSIWWGKKCCKTAWM